LCSAGAPASNDTAPQADVAGLDPSRIKPEYGAVDASLNGPKLSMIDWAEADIEVRRQSSGIHTDWVSQLNMEEPEKVSESTQYKPITIAPERGIGWNKGTKVLMIDDTDGNAWVMKGFELRLNPQQTHAQFIISRK
jgi:hypothetical protein